MSEQGSRFLEKDTSSAKYRERVIVLDRKLVNSSADV